MLGKLDAHLGLPFSHWRTYTEGTLLVWRYAGLGEGPYGQSEIAPLALLLWSFSVSVVHGGASASLTPGFWDFHNVVLPMGSCWLGFFMRGSKIKNDLYCPLDDITPQEGFLC